MADRMSLTSLVFGQVGRLLSGHPVGCGCARCQELDGDAARLTELLVDTASARARRAPAAPPARAEPLPAPKKARAKRPKALPAKIVIIPDAPKGDALEPEVLEPEVLPPTAPRSRR